MVWSMVLLFTCFGRTVQLSLMNNCLHTWPGHLQLSELRKVPGRGENGMEMHRGARVHPVPPSHLERAQGTSAFPLKHCLKLYGKPDFI